jgi:broad specificity polyphosphatase/5'/3'-nucleotidase SurE
MKTDPPDLVVPGINGGANIADDWLWSGTVGAATAAALRAASLPSPPRSRDRPGWRTNTAWAISDRRVPKLVPALGKQRNEPRKIEAEEAMPG